MSLLVYVYITPCSGFPCILYICMYLGSCSFVCDIYVPTYKPRVLLWASIRIMLCIYKPWVMIHSDVIVDAYGRCGSGNPLPLIGGEEA